MLDGALGRLFGDLQSIKQEERSPYEKALHSELASLQLLIELAQRLGQPQTELASRSPAILEPLMQMMIDAQNISGVVVDLNPGASDTKRLSCSKPDCPIKRR